MTNPTASTPAAASTTTTPRPAATRTETASAMRPTAPAATGTGASSPTSTANRGRYHTIETGDTLEKLAKDNNIAVDTLREANRLPAGARPLKGQRLFIPPARQ
jgi:LysM repeat protein